MLEQVVRERKLGMLQQRVEQLALDQAKQLEATRQLQEMVTKLLEVQTKERSELHVRLPQSQEQ